MVLTPSGRIIFSTVLLETIISEVTESIFPVKVSTLIGQSFKAFSPHFLAPPVILISASSLQPENASLPTEVTVAGMVTSSMPNVAVTLSSASFSSP